ncbi:hypothetical protein D6850_05070 [Roseovarius spongiae]|uniref:Uncharacterized protein n=1 Tax=Roseovarius spongiae TaxID=2320272 RepID=A0A3A8AWY3_9RHOB|nr:hypothetical protein [Roseovarius spongiae]RKF16903.1 hypothetical protein D6850_05070 [Roseovarius spongiae]
MQDQINDATLEELVFEALRKARLAVAALRKGMFTCSAKDDAFISRCLSKLEAGHILGEDVEGTLDAVRRVLSREIEKETFETKRVFDGYHDPEFGDVGRVFEIPVRTVRGDDLAELLAQLDGLSEARNAALDRLRAEKEVRKRI